jgi:DNA polymerase III subunit epsilon
MSPRDWFPRLRGPQLTDQQLRRRDALPPVVQAPDAGLKEVRWIVMDLETTGLNTQKDQILSIGAVVIENGVIAMGTQFERTLYRADHRFNESTLIHGIAPSEVQQGIAVADGLLDFLEFAGDGVMLAFHAPFDQRMLVRGLRQDLGYKLQHRFIDVAEMAPMLCPDAQVGRGGLDDWQRHFGLNNERRHNAAADALATAQIAMILLSKARAQGIQTLGQLQERLGHWRRLRQARTNSM